MPIILFHFSILFVTKASKNSIFMLAWTYRGAFYGCTKSAVGRSCYWYKLLWILGGTALSSSVNERRLYSTAKLRETGCNKILVINPTNCVEYWGKNDFINLNHPSSPPPLKRVMSDGWEFKRSEKDLKILALPPGKKCCDLCNNSLGEKSNF